MSSTTRAHTVKYTPDAYLVRDAAGATVERFPFDGDDFHGSRRVAYRAALAHAAELDAQAERELVSAEIAVGGELVAAPVPCLRTEPGPAIPEDAQAEHCPGCDRQFWRSEMSGRCYDLLSGRQIFSCPCGCDLTPHLSNGGPLNDLDAEDDGPDDPPPSPLAMARCIWRFGGTATALRGYLTLAKRAA